MILKSCFLLIMVAFAFPVLGQIDTFPPEAEMKLVSLIEHEKFTFKLDKFSKEGIPNLSMSKGKEFIRIGADLPTILKEVWPKQIFEIPPRLLNDNYHLMIQHLDHEANDELFSLILDAWIDDDGWLMKKQKKTLKINCVKKSDLAKLSKLTFTPEREVIKMTSRKPDQIILNGYTVEEMLGILSHEYHQIYMYEEVGSKEFYNFKIDTDSQSDIINSIKKMGFEVEECYKEIDVVSLD